jgi:hypothetical protein
MIQYRTIDSPIGPLVVAGHDSVLTNLPMVDQSYEPSRAGWSLEHRPARWLRRPARHGPRTEPPGVRRTTGELPTGS